MADAHSTDTYVDWVERITRDVTSLDTWEEEFIESMLDKISRYGSRVEFSDKEKAKIEEIYTEKTS